MSAAMADQRTADQVAWLIERLCEGRPIFGSTAGRSSSYPGLTAAIIRALQENPCFERLHARRAAWRSLAAMEDAGGQLAFEALLEAVTDPEVGPYVSLRLALTGAPDRLLELVQRLDSLLRDAPTRTVARWMQALRALGREAQTLAPHIERVVRDESLSRRERAHALGVLGFVAGGAEALAVWESLPSRDLGLLHEGLAQYVVETLGTLEAPPAVRRRFRDYVIEMIRNDDPELHHELLAMALFVFSTPECIVAAPDGKYQIDPRLEQQLRKVIGSHSDAHWRREVATLLDYLHQKLPERVRVLRARGLTPGVSAPPLRLRYGQSLESALAAARDVATRDRPAVRQELVRWVQTRHQQYARLGNWIGPIEPWTRLVRVIPESLLDHWGVEWFQRSFDQIMQALLGARHGVRSASDYPLCGRLASAGLARVWTPTDQRWRRGARFRQGCLQLKQQLLKAAPLTKQNKQTVGPPHGSVLLGAGRVRKWWPLFNWARLLSTSIFYAHAAAALDDPKWDRSEAWEAPVRQLVDDLLRGMRDVRIDALEDAEFQQILAEALLWRIASLPPQHPTTERLAPATQRAPDRVIPATQPAAASRVDANSARTAGRAATRPAPSPAAAITARDRAAFERLYRQRIAELRKILQRGP